MDLFFAYSSGVLRKYRLKEGAQKGTYRFVKQKELSIENGIRSFHLVNSKLWIGGYDSMFILNHDLDLLKTDFSVKRITAITIFDDIYILAENLSIKFFNKRFLMINEFIIDKLVGVPVGTGIEGIQVYKGYVYMFDDMCKPSNIYRFKLPLDLKRPIQTDGFLHLYHFTRMFINLTSQFLVPDKKYWCVLSGSRSLSGMSKDILLFDLYQTQELSQYDQEESIYKDLSKIKHHKEYNIFSWGVKSGWHGNMVIDIIQIAPNYCMALDLDFHLVLYELIVDSEGARFGYLHLLNENPDKKRINYYDRSLCKGKLYRKGHFLYGWYQLLSETKFFVFNLKRSTLDMNVEHDDFIMMDSLVNIEICW